MKQAFLTAFLLAPVIILAAATADGADSKGKSMTYGDVRSFLAKHTELVELTNADGARVAVCPQWQGRVMTSTCGDLTGPSFGFVNNEFIEEGKNNPHFNNFGGEERMWLSPEGGQFSLWFKPGDKQNLDNWLTPPAFNEGAWKVTSNPNEPLRMSAMMKFSNASATTFSLEATRGVRLLAKSDLAKLLGAGAADEIAQKDVRCVAYETTNQIINRGDDMTKEKGLLSIWILGMLNSGPESVVIVPYRSGDEAKLGPIVKSDYFGTVPPERLKMLPEAVLLRADGNYRAKIGVSQRRVKNILGSIDFAHGVLTIVNFTMADDPTQSLYMNNQWGGPLEKPYVGDVANSYNDGPPAPGKKGLGPFYEIESLSPAKELKKGESLEHCHRTIHIQAKPETLAKLAKELLGVELHKVKSEMLAK